MLSGRGLCDELITRPEESYRLCCVVVCDLETSRIGALYTYIYIYDISSLRVKYYLAAEFHEIVYDNWAILGLCITLLYLLTFAWRWRQKCQASSYIWGKIRRFS